MLFKKKKRMVDVRELQKRGVVRIPKNDSVVPMNQEGFVDMASSQPTPTSPTSSTSSTNQNFLGFMDNQSPSSNSFSSSAEGYNKREVDEKITNLDNKIYKLEQRIELLERKAGVGSSVSTDTEETNVGVAGW